MRSACGRSKSHRYGGNIGLTPARMAMKRMHVWRDKLELGTSCKGYCLFEGSAGFIVHDLEINRQTPCSKISHDDVVGSKTMGITLGFERLLEDQVAICMVRNHDILVS